MKVKDVMSRRVAMVTLKTTFRDIGNIIFGKHPGQKFSSVPVVDKKGKLLGIVTEKDLLMQLYPTQKEIIEDFFRTTNFSAMEEKIHEVEKLTAQQLMTESLSVVQQNTPLMKAGSLMLVKRVRRLPVVNKKGKLVGIISQGDVFRAIFFHHCKFHTHRF